MKHAADGSTIDVGRRSRTIPPALRRALDHRDRGCRFPGCDCKFCDAHHIQHWADGGETRLGNLLLLCRRHHRAVHEEGFGIELGDGAEATFSWPDGRPFEPAPGPPAVASFADFVRRARRTSGDRVNAHSNLPSWEGGTVDFRLALEAIRRE